MGDDFFSGIANVVGAAVQGIEHEAESVVGNVMGGISGGQTHGASPVGGGSAADSMSNFDIGGFLSGGLSGIAGGLMGQFGGDAFGILGNIFASPTEAGANVAGYAHTGSFTGSASGSVSASVNGSAQPPPGHAPTSSGSTKAASSGTAAQGTASGGVKAGDPRLEAAAEAIETIMINFSQFEGSVKTPYSGANGLPSGLVDRQSLLRLVNDPATGQDLKRAAEFLLNNPDVMNQLCTQLGMPNSGSFTFGQLDSMDGLLTDMKKGKATGGGITLPPPPPGHSAEASTAAPADGASGSTAADDGAKLAADLEAEAKKSSSSNGKSGSSSGSKSTSSSGSTKKSSGGDSFSGAIGDLQKQVSDLMNDARTNPDNAQADFEQIKNLDLQIQALMNMEQELFTMKSEMQKAFHDMSMTAIRNING